MNNFSRKKKWSNSIVSSIAGYRGLPNSGGYVPSKSALNSFAESLYFDIKRKMYVFHWLVLVLLKHL
jgi:short-subunit dehydrogenase